MKTSRPIFIWLFMLLSVLGYSQVITSTILDERTNQPLESVSIYYDGTTIGTVTNSKGQFTLSTEMGIQAIIVISYLGYETRYFNQDELANATTIYLKESAENLDAVVLEYDPWSRKKKLDIFRKEFLGSEASANQCRILNEAAITLIYQPSKERLVAYCDEPILIKNNHLGYEIKYNLVDFEVQFDLGSSGFRFTKNVYLVGSTAFKELVTPARKRHVRARKSAYLGSYLEFMRALNNKDLAAKKYRCFVEDTVGGSRVFKPVLNPYTYLAVSQEDSMLTKVKMNFEKLVIQYNNNQQSGIIPQEGTDHFYIDAFGIHSPPTAFFFSGDFGVKRVAGMLPLDYGIETP